MGVTPLPHYYGGSDFCLASHRSGKVSPDRSPAFTCVLFARPTIANHPNRHPLRIRVCTQGSPGLRPTDFATRSQARRGCCSRITFTCHYGRSGSLQLLSTPPLGDAVTLSSRQPYGDRRPRSLTSEEGAAQQRTSAGIPARLALADDFCRAYSTCRTREERWTG